ncbi:O-antigen ligase family protein, partial [Paenibacillus tarimensis]
MAKEQQQYRMFTESAGSAVSAEVRERVSLTAGIIERRASLLQEIVPAVLAAIVLTTAAWRSGMYFDTAYYRWELAVIVASLLLGLPRLCRWPAANIIIPGSRSDCPAVGPAESRISWLLVLLPLTTAGIYGISLAMGTVSVLGSINGLVRWCSLTAFAMLLLAVNPGFRQRWLLAALQVTAAWIAGGSLAGWIGLTQAPGSVLLSDNGDISALGARLAGFFEYPNMLGAVAGSLLLLQLLLLAVAGSRRETVLPGLLACWLAIVLLLTESRGAWLVVLICWMAGLVWAGKGRRLQWMLYTGWTALGAAAGAWLLVPAAGRHMEKSGGTTPDGLVITGDIAADLLMLLCLTAAFCGGCSLIVSQSDRQRSRGRRLPAWVKLLVSCSLGAGAWLLLPESLTGRLEGHNATASARGMLYRDGWELIQGAPWLGYGGDAWQALFQAHQDMPYVGAEVHSGYISLLLGIGTAGLLVVAAYIVTLLLPVWRHNRLGLTPLLVLIIHAAVDFDMSYGFYWLLLLTMGICLGAAPVAMQAAHAVPAAFARRRDSSAEAGRQRARPALSVAALCIAATLAAAAVTAWRLDTARAARDAAAAAEGAARADALRAALAANPAWTRIRLELAPLAPAGERAALLAGGL